jgi:hypothetical protein
MEAAEKTGMSMGHQIHARSGESDEMAMSGMNPPDQSHFPGYGEVL